MFGGPMKVLLPVSDSYDSKLILDFAGNYRWLKGTEFRVIHVVGSCESDAEAKEATEKATQLVEAVATKTQAMLAECKVTSEIVIGMPVFEITQAAHDWKANMIVMGYRAERMLHPCIAGSVSRGVTLQAPCSVAVIRPPEDLREETAAAALTEKGQTGSASAELSAKGSSKLRKHA